MTEADWQSCEIPIPMLESLRGKASDRKLRLFACACCRSIWHILTDPSGREAVEVAERFSDGASDARSLSKVHSQAKKSWARVNSSQPQAYEISRDAGEAGGMLIVAINASTDCSSKNAFAAAWSANVCAAHAVGKEAAIRVAPASYDVESNIYSREEQAGRKKQYAQQSQLMRDIFGNPYRPVSVDNSWLTEAVVGLANGIYADRAFERMPVLADALQDAGCIDPEILDHCRAESIHVRGCWVVDLLLGKE